MIKVIRRLLNLLTIEQPFRFYVLLASIVLMAVIEVVGVASIMPFVAVLTRPEVIHESQLLNWLYQLLRFQDQGAFLIFLGFVTLSALVISNAYTFLTTWALLRFTNMRDYALSRRLLLNYLRKPYSFYLNRNSTDLCKNLLSEVSLVVYFVLVPGMRMLAKSTVALFILILLFIVQPVVTLSIVLIMGSAYALVYTVVQRRLAANSSLRVVANSARFRTTSELFGGIKEVFLYGREDEFVGRFSNSARSFSKCQATNQMIAELPRYVMESFVFGSALAVILTLLILGADLTSLLPVIALFALAGYRLMPAMQQIFQSLAQIKANLSSVDALRAELAGEEELEHRLREETCRRREKTLEFKRSIVLEDICFRYESANNFTIEDMSLKIERNTSIALVGATGSGKTTLVDILMGLLEPQKGLMSVDGVELGKWNLGEWQRLIGYVPQQIYLADDTIRRNIAFGIADEKIDDAAVERAARIANIHGFIEKLELGYRSVVGERGVRISGGERQRIGLARALYHDPEVLVMDEATSSLDGITEDIVMSAINNLAHKKTIILIAHRLSTVRECDVIYLLDNGRLIASGSYEELARSNEQFSSMAQYAKPSVSGEFKTDPNN